MSFLNDDDFPTQIGVEVHDITDSDDEEADHDLCKFTKFRGYRSEESNFFDKSNVEVVLDTINSRTANFHDSMALETRMREIDYVKENCNARFHPNRSNALHKEKDDFLSYFFEYSIFAQTLNSLVEF